MKRLLSRGGIEIWHGDSEEFDWPADIDLLLTDPPYGKVYKSTKPGSAGEQIEGDTDQPKIDAVLAQVWLRLRPHRHGYVFGPLRPLEAATTDLVWDKTYTATGDLTQAWGISHEPIVFYAHRYRSEPTAGSLAARLRRGTVLRVIPPRGRVKRNHPNEKPVRLCQALIESSSLVGDLVVDPFCGAGSTAVAAILLGRRYIGIDIDLKYAQRAADRASAALAALDGIC